MAQIQPKTNKSNRLVIWLKLNVSPMISGAGPRKPLSLFYLGEGWGSAAFFLPSHPKEQLLFPAQRPADLAMGVSGGVKQGRFPPAGTEGQRIAVLNQG